jgi:hypothetical protein
MVVLVVVGFRNMSISRLVVFLVIVKSRKLIWPAFSGVGLICMLLCIVLAYCVISLGLVCEEWHICGIVVTLLVISSVIHVFLFL